MSKIRSVSLQTLTPGIAKVMAPTIASIRRTTSFSDRARLARFAHTTTVTTICTTGRNAARSSSVKPSASSRAWSTTGRISRLTSANAAGATRGYRPATLSRELAWLAIAAWNSGETKVDRIPAIDFSSAGPLTFAIAAWNSGETKVDRIPAIDFSSAGPLTFAIAAWNSGETKVDRIPAIDFSSAGPLTFAIAAWNSGETKVDRIPAIDFSSAGPLTFAIAAWNSGEGNGASG